MRFDLYKEICDLQNDKDFQSESLKIVFTEHDDTKKVFYLPHFIMRAIDMEYYKTMNSKKFKESDFEIVLTEYESFSGFLKFLRIFFDGKTSLNIKEDREVHALVFAYRFNQINIYWINPNPRYRLGMIDFKILANNAPPEIIQDVFGRWHFSEWGESTDYALDITPIIRYLDKIPEKHCNIEADKSYPLYTLSRFDHFFFRGELEKRRGKFCRIEDVNYVSKVKELEEFWAIFPPQIMKEKNAEVIIKSDPILIKKEGIEYVYFSERGRVYCK